MSAPSSHPSRKKRNYIHETIKKPKDYLQSMFDPKICPIIHPWYVWLRCCTNCIVHMKSESLITCMTVHLISLIQCMNIYVKSVARKRVIFVRLRLTTMPCITHWKMLHNSLLWRVRHLTEIATLYYHQQILNIRRYKKLDSSWNVSHML